MNFIERGVQKMHFRVGELETFCSFCSATSASFRIGKGVQRGWIDVHFPCEGHIKVQVRGAVPAELLNYKALHALTMGLFERLGIPLDETYEGVFFRAIDQIGLSQHVNRDGWTDTLAARKGGRHSRS